MKFVTSLLLLIALTVTTHAQVLISSPGVENSTTMPGSSTDFTYFGNPDQFTGGRLADRYGSGTQPTVLDDFTAVAGADAEYTYGPAAGTAPTYGSIVDPAGVSAKTGLLYSIASSAPDLVRFTLGSSSTFDYSDFNVFVMISNAPTSGLDDSSILASVYDPSGAVLVSTPFTLTVTDADTATGTATFEEINILGASSGDILQFGATSANKNASYISGISFSSNTTATPEPSTYALMGVSLLALLIWQSRRRTA